MLALLALSVAAIWIHGLRLVAVSLDAALLVLVVYDVLRAPSPKRLDVRRSLPERAGLGEEFRRVTRVGSGRAGGLRVAVAEEFASALEVVARTVDGAMAPPRVGDPSGGPDGAVLPGDGSVDLVRVYRSTRRGVHAVGHLRVRITGPLGLVERQSRLAGERTIAIEPALLGLSQTLKLAASERWQDLGVRRLRRRGGLTEFESLRDYVHGDDVRLVDWKAYARRGEPTVREYQEERGQELVLVVDCGRRMGATTADGRERGWTKLDHALDTALQIAAVALQQGDRVGIAAFDARLVTFVPTARGARQLARLSEAVFDLLPSELDSDLDRALRELAVRQRRRAMLIVLSDVADPLSVDRQRRALATGARHHRVLFAGLDDPSLRAAAEGRSGERASVRAAALGLVGERTEGLKVLAGSGARVVDALPAESAAPLLAAWLDVRRSGVR